MRWKDDNDDDDKEMMMGKEDVEELKEGKNEMVTKMMEVREVTQKTMGEEGR